MAEAARELESAGPPAPEDLPGQWAKWVSYAYLRITGSPQAEAAKMVGRKERTVRGWEADERFVWAEAEAQQRWLARWGGNMSIASRRRILTAVTEEKDTESAWRYLERTDVELAPPVQRSNQKVDMSARMLHGVVEIPAESEGLESRDAGEVIGEMGRNLEAMAAGRSLPPSAEADLEDAEEEEEEGEPVPVEEPMPKSRKARAALKRIRKRREARGIELPEETDGTE